MSRLQMVFALVSVLFSAEAGAEPLPPWTNLNGGQVLTTGTPESPILAKGFDGRWILGWVENGQLQFRQSVDGGQSFVNLPVDLLGTGFDRISHLQIKPLAGADWILFFEGTRNGASGIYALQMEPQSKGFQLVDLVGLDANPSAVPDLTDFQILKRDFRGFDFVTIRGTKLITGFWQGGRTLVSQESWELNATGTNLQIFSTDGLNPFFFVLVRESVGGFPRWEVFLLHEGALVNRWILDAAPDPSTGVLVQGGQADSGSLNLELVAGTQSWTYSWKSEALVDQQSVTLPFAATGSTLPEVGKPAAFWCIDGTQVQAASWDQWGPGTPRTGTFDLSGLKLIGKQPLVSGNQWNFWSAETTSTGDHLVLVSGVLGDLAPRQRGPDLPGVWTAGRVGMGQDGWHIQSVSWKDLNWALQEWTLDSGSLSLVANQELDATAQNPNYLFRQTSGGWVFGFVPAWATWSDLTSDLRSIETYF